MTKRVYIETTIPSYLAAWPSRDLLQAARQQITHDWWNHERANYELCISEIVLDEAFAGDSDAAKRRLTFLVDLPLLDVTDAVNVVAKGIIDSGLLPQKATRAKGNTGCDPHCSGIGSRHRFSSDMELPTHCQCRDHERVANYPDEF